VRVFSTQSVRLRRDDLQGLTDSTRARDGAVTRWPTCAAGGLPDLYSRYASQKIVVLADIQSWAQGGAVGGNRGCGRSGAPSNVKIFGCGVSELRFLEDLSQLNGECASGCPRPLWVPLTGTPIATASLNGLSPVIWMNTWVTGLMTSLSLHLASNSDSGSPK
jgi:hypothetical protein